MKKEYVILIIAIAVLSAYLLLGNGDRTHYDLPEIKTIKKSEISRIDVRKDGTTLELKRAGDAWHIGKENYPADGTKAAAMLDAISGLKLTAMVSEAKTYGRFDLTEGKKITVTGHTDAGDSITFDVGKAAATHQHTFVLIPGDDRVYHARGNFRRTFDVDTDDIRDKTVFSVNKEEVQELILKKGGETLMLTRNTSEKKSEDAMEGDAGADTSENSWISSTSQPVDEGEVDRLLAALKEVKCVKYVYDRKKDEFTDPLYTVTLKGSREATLSFYPMNTPEHTEYPAVSSENGWPFILPKWKAEKIMIDFNELVKTEA